MREFSKINERDQATDSEMTSVYNVGDQVQSLGWEDPLEKGMAAHSSILAWQIPWTEEPGGLQSIRSQSQTQISDLHTREPQRNAGNL